jgi:hypothetical protein
MTFLRAKFNVIFRDTKGFIYKSDIIKPDLRMPR